ncbi:MAG: outer membrane beta-barrel family protein, partial [Muribaculaceae bacterium]|nr:outer membrane beta-barrel family protein [Muribaculaceae bacterium]
ASIGYTLGQSSNLGLNYNMRISRPGISYLNPYVDQADPTVITYGNPDLDVESTHNVSLVYNLFTPKFSFNATLSNAYTGNGIEQYSFMADGVMNTTYGNIVRRNTTSLNVYLNWLVSAKTRIFLNGGASYLDIRSRQLDARNSGLQGNMMLGVQQQLPYSIRANAFLIASTKSRTLQGWNTGFRIISLNFSKSFLDDRLGVSLGVNAGLTKGGRIEMDTYVNTLTFSNHTAIRVPIASVNLGITYRFGSRAKAKEVRSKFIENDYIGTRSQMEEIESTTGVQ